MHASTASALTGDGHCSLEEALVRIAFEFAQEQTWQGMLGRTSRMNAGSIDGPVLMPPSNRYRSGRGCKATHC